MAIKEKMADIIEMPKEIVLNYPKMIVTGKREIVVENIIGIIEFTDKLIRLSTETHILKICGYMLVIKNLSTDGIEITGEIVNVVFE